MYINIEVKPEDTLDAVRNNAEYCPVAKALKRQYPSVRVRVYRTSILLGSDTYWNSANLSRIIHNYDAEGQDFPVGTYRAMIKRFGA